MKKIISAILAVMLIIIICVPAISAEPSGKYNLPEYDHLHLTPEEKSADLDQVFGNTTDNIFLFKAYYVGIYRYFAEDMPIDDIIGKISREHVEYVYLTSYGKRTEVSFVSNYNGTPEWVLDNDTTVIPLIKTLRRNDFFKQVKITEDYDDIVIIQAYFSIGWPCIDLFVTNYGYYVFYKGCYVVPGEVPAGGTNLRVKDKEYLFPIELVYQYADAYDRDLEDIMSADGVDLSLYEVKVPSNELPLPEISDFESAEPGIPMIPNTSDISVIFPILGIISAGGFTLFAVKRKKNK